MRGRLSLSLVALLASHASALAADCLQEQAIYGDRDNAYEIRFEPVGSQSAATTNHFKIAVLKSGAVLDGIVQQSEEPARPNGMVMFNCPEGDATGAEIAACTVWEGVIYSVDAAGKIDLLAPEGTDAAAQLLFPALGPSIRRSTLWDDGKASIAPWDVLTLKGCKP